MYILRIKEPHTQAEHSGGAALNSVQANIQRAVNNAETPSELQAQLDEMQAIELDELREVRVIVGTRDQLGRDPIDLMPYNVFELAVAGVAGGFTLTHGTGAWIDPQGVLINEPVRIYDIAIAPRNQQRILWLAISLGSRTDQHSIYFRNTDGVVAIMAV